MARMRRSSEETLELKIEQAEEKVAKTRAAHEKAVDELKKLYDIRKARQNEEILKAWRKAAGRSMRSWLSWKAEMTGATGESGRRRPLGYFFLEVHNVTKGRFLGVKNQEANIFAKLTIVHLIDFSSNLRYNVDEKGEGVDDNA